MDTLKKRRWFENREFPNFYRCYFCHLQTEHQGMIYYFRYYPNFFIVLSIQAVLQIYFSLEHIIELNSNDNIVNILTCTLKSLQLL